MACYDNVFRILRFPSSVLVSNFFLEMEFRRVEKFRIPVEKSWKKKLEAEENIKRWFWMLVCEIKDKPKAKIDNISQSTSKITGWEKVYTHPLLTLPCLQAHFSFVSYQGVVKKKKRKILYCRSLMSARKNSTCSHYKLYRLIEFLFDFLLLFFFRIPPHYGTYLMCSCLNINISTWFTYAYLSVEVVL